ncbi:MAG: hypothetical protein KatS3mg004_0813 [Bryobacteraceae bacterium]|nr:MAG: hypothetical protein KatS3mg004_0813 [Bryobacteraceae bacterium]
MSEQLSLGGPYLAYAVICERVLTETDGTISLIRIIDRFTIRGPSPSLAPTVVSFWLAILFRRGFPRGVMKLTLQPTTPSGKTVAAMEIALHFEGDEEHGCQAALPVQFLVEEDGLYWFDVRLEGQLITRIPLRIVYLPTVTMPGPGPESPMNR